MGLRTGQRRIWDPKPIFFLNRIRSISRNAKETKAQINAKRKFKTSNIFEFITEKNGYEFFWRLEIGGGRSSSRRVTGPRDGLKCTYWKKEKKKRNIRMEANTDQTRSTTSLASNETYDCSIPDLRKNDRRKKWLNFLSPPELNGELQEKVE